jgi:ribosomal protein S19E (S16A)
MRLGLPCSLPTLGPAISRDWAWLLAALILCRVEIFSTIGIDKITKAAASGSNLHFKLSSRLIVKAILDVFESGGYDFVPVQNTSRQSQDCGD